MKRKLVECEDDFELPKSSNLVKRYSNKIYFYSPVTKQNVLKLNELIDELNKTPYETIEVYIHSLGGDVYAGLSAMDMLFFNKKHIITIADGFVASAATFILLGGHEKKIFPHCDVLIHQMSTESSGRYHELKDDMENNSKLMNKMKSIYRNKTQIPIRDLNTLLEKEVVLDANQCQKWGIVNEIIIN
tara:strand:- start:3074 stop:3637 length:564 start_codon:yes stop_codon:yes gene_type:complete